MISLPLEMESELPEPCHIDFSKCLEDEQRESLPVFLRIKPQEDEQMSIKILSATTIETNHAFRANKRATYTQVFPGSSTQLEVFNGTTANLIKKFLHGANVMTFAYGVTSSGKTHTIMGSHVDPGILPRTLEIIFVSLKSKIAETMPVLKPTRFDEVNRISIEESVQLELLKSTLISKVRGSCDAFDQYAFSQTTSDVPSRTRDEQSPFPADAACGIWISIYEIQNEVITDLLSAESKDKRKALNIGQDSKNRTFIKDLTQIPVASASEAYALLQFARQSLATASTKLNDCSSRSHMVFNLRMVHCGGSLAEPHVNQFVIGDLAGSERQAKTGTSGLTLKQASAINNSLLVLGRCLEALRKKNKGIAAPFRDSKLTRMLNPFFALGGYVSLIICINPGMHLQDETIETVRFSAIASEIVQNPVTSLDTLSRLRRLTFNGAQSSAPMFDDTDIVSWQDAVDAAIERNGVAYLEVKASYFNDMARDILRAERLLAANVAEIDELKERLKELEISKENVKLMYQDKMKEQRDKFAEQRSNLEELYRDLQKALVEDYETDIRTVKEKYLKYKDGYAKLSTYITEKLWPEVCLFRERFGCLPEFPPRDGPENEEVEQKNTVRYWQDKLHDKEVEYRSLRTEFNHKTEQLVILEKRLDDQMRVSQTVELENQHFRREITEMATRNEELSAQLAAVRNQQRDHELPLGEVVPVSELNRQLKEAEEISESPIGVPHQIRLSALTEELESLKTQLSEKTSRLEETSGALAAAGAEIEILNGKLASLEKLGRSRSGEGSTRFSGRAELEQKVVELESEVSQQTMRAAEFQNCIRILRDDVERLTASEAELKEREVLAAFKLRDARRARIADYVTVPVKVGSKRPQEEPQVESPLGRDTAVVPQKAALGEFERQLKTIEALGRQMHKLSRENKENRETLKTLLRGDKHSDVEAKLSGQLEAGTEFRGRRLEKRHGKILRDYPQPEKAIRRLRSASSCGVELKVPSAIERPRRRLRLDNEDDSNPKMAARQPVRYSSPATKIRKTRSSRRG